MMPLPRPPDAAKSRWRTLERTMNAKKTIDDAIANGKKPEELESKDFKPAWSEDTWKEALSTSQNGLCAWCSREPKEGGSSGQVDHIRPKSEVYRDVIINPPRNGHIKRERHLPQLHPGYYWLAYDPDNLVFCCQLCNINKSSFWPVEPWRTPNAPASWKPPSQGVQELELVLDPFDPFFDPLKHFQFGKDGAMFEVPGDRRARATIDLVGLDKPPFTEQREKVFITLETDLRSLIRLFDSSNTGADDTGLAQRMANRCQWSSPHAAFYRVALRKLLQDRKWAWNDLFAMWNLYGISTSIPEPAADSWRE